MVTIRNGMMKDCSDLLEVYQGTRWFYRMKEGGYTTVEEVKEEHRGAAFERWGWLVAEEKGRVIGEIVFRVEKAPLTGRIGIIRNLDVDVRKQKRMIGTQLTKAAEGVMKGKNVVRVVATTPPSAYNYWMKIKYFARGSIVKLSLPLSKVPDRRNSSITLAKLKDLRRLPAKMKFSNIAYPGLFAEHAAEVIDGRVSGNLLEFYFDRKMVGVGVITRSDANHAQFVIDVSEKGKEYSDIIISRTIKSAAAWKFKTIGTMIPKEQLGVYMSLTKWSSELATDIPVTKLI